MVCLLGFRSWITESSLFLTRQLMVATSPSTTVTSSVTRFWPSPAGHSKSRAQGQEQHQWVPPGNESSTATMEEHGPGIRCLWVPIQLLGRGAGRRSSVMGQRNTDCCPTQKHQKLPSSPNRHILLNYLQRTTRCKKHLSLDWSRQTSGNQSLLTLCNQ